MIRYLGQELRLISVYKWGFLFGWKKNRFIFQIREARLSHI